MCLRRLYEPAHFNKKRQHHRLGYSSIQSTGSSRGDSTVGGHGPVVKRADPSTGMAIDRAVGKPPRPDHHLRGLEFQPPSSKTRRREDGSVERSRIEVDSAPMASSFMDANLGSPAAFQSQSDAARPFSAKKGLENLPVRERSAAKSRYSRVTVTQLGTDSKRRTFDHRSPGPRSSEPIVAPRRRAPSALWLDDAADFSQPRPGA